MVHSSQTENESMRRCEVEALCQENRLGLWLVLGVNQGAEGLSVNSGLMFAWGWRLGLTSYLGVPPEVEQPKWRLVNLRHRVDPSTISLGTFRSNTLQAKSQGDLFLCQMFYYLAAYNAVAYKKNLWDNSCGGFGGKHIFDSCCENRPSL